MLSFCLNYSCMNDPSNFRNDTKCTSKISLPHLQCNSRGQARLCLLYRLGEKMQWGGRVRVKKKRSLQYFSPVCVSSAYVDICMCSVVCLLVGMHTHKCCNVALTCMCAMHACIQMSLLCRQRESSARSWQKTRRMTHRKLGSKVESCPSTEFSQALTCQ